MGSNSKIEWTDHTFNPWIGCTKVSAGCTNCYAETLMDTRYGRVTWGKGNPRKRTSEANWKKPIKWNKDAEAEGIRRRVFCASLADFFDNEVPDQWRHDTLDLFVGLDHLDLLLLTKRAKAARAFFLKHGPPPARVWLGVSIEDQPTADERTSILLQIPATVHFISYEPALGPVDLLSVPYKVGDDSDSLGTILKNHVTGYGIDWVIVGGESGPKARPMHPDWPRSIRDQCAAGDVAFFFKQWGEWAPTGPSFGTHQLTYDGDLNPVGRPIPQGIDRVAYVHRMGKKNAGRFLESQTWSEFPNVEVLR